MAVDDDLSVEYIRRVWDYDPESGLLIWRTANIRFAGKQAGHIEFNGYVVVVHKQIWYKAHRLAWIHYHGSHPVGEIDHIDTDRANNRITNLREASDPQQNWNAKCRRDNRCGIKGVRFQKDCTSHPWIARLQVNGKRHFVGGFPTKEEAAAALKAFRERVHGEYANHGAK